MFTGIIEDVGTVRAVQHSGSHSFIRIEAKTVLEDVHRGDSIAVNGVCLTVTQFDSMSFQADVMNETLRRSALGSLTNGSHVNLERAMPANGRFGGHIVSGHIDGTGTVTRMEPDGIAVRITVTTENIEQAIERAGSKAGNKGSECAEGAIEMINLIRAIEA